MFMESPLKHALSRSAETEAASPLSPVRPARLRGGDDPRPSIAGSGAMPSVVLPRTAAPDLAERVGRGLVEARRLRAKAWTDAVRTAARMAVDAAALVGAAFAGLAGGVVEEAERHAARRRERDALARLAENRHLMRDVGLDPMEVRRLLDAPDWRR